MAAVDLTVGAQLTSFESVKAAIDKYERKHFVQYYKRSSRSIESYRKHYPIKKDLHICADIVYLELDYACTHGGKEFQSKASQRTKGNSSANEMCNTLSLFCNEHLTTGLTKYHVDL